MDPIRALLEYPAPERRLGPFLLIEQLGRGGFAPVWLARETYGATELRAAAVKLFSLEAGGAALRAQIIEEARALCQVEHPNVVRFYALPIDEERGVVGLAMEYVAGRSLDRQLATEGTLALPVALAVGVAIASALAAVHRSGLVHADVKPANLVESGGVYKLIDFGIAAAETRPKPGRARAVLPDDVGVPSGTKMTALDTIVPTGGGASPLGFASGTVGYIDPEHVATGEPTSSASDLYSLGATIFECLTGRLPAASANGRLRGDVLDGRAYPPSLGEVMPDAPASLVSLVDSLLEPSGVDRPRSAETVAAAFAAVLREVSGRTAAAEGQVVTTAEPPPASGTPASRGPAWGLKRGIAAATMVAVAASGVIVVARSIRGASTSPTHAIPSASGPFAAAPTAIASLPPSSTCSDAATPSYRAGLQAVRESSYEAAHAAFNRAVELDDGCVSAHLRLVLAAESDPRTTQREHLRKATLGRATLAARDRAILPAAEALVTADTPDWEAFRTAVEQARDAFPGDAELHFLTALANRSLNVRWSEVRDGAQRAVQLDPEYGDAWQVLADAEQELGHEADALRALDSCLRVAPSSLDCLAYRVEADRAQGRCDQIAAAARRKISLNPTGPSGHALLAAALVDTGADGPVVLEVLQQRWAVVPTAARRSTELSDRSALAVLAGDFGAARDVARSMERLAEGDPNLAAHVDGAHLDLELALESGQVKVAASIAEAFLRRRAAWIPGDNASSQTAAYMPIFIDALLRGGLIDEATARQRVDAWFAIRGAVTVVDDWAFREALFVTDEAQARRAVERYDPGWLSRLHNQWRKVWARSNRRARIVGSTLVRAGRANDAIPWLRGVTESCTSLETPFEAVRAHRWLGEALERTGDKAGACGAYAAVVAHWGKAKPRSVTADDAAWRAKALGCEMTSRLGVDGAASVITSANAASPVRRRRSPRARIPTSRDRRSLRARTPHNHRHRSLRPSGPLPPGLLGTAPPPPGPTCPTPPSRSALPPFHHRPSRHPLPPSRRPRRPLRPWRHPHLRTWAAATRSACSTPRSPGR